MKNASAPLKGNRPMISGTKGYEKYISLFIESCQALSFHDVCNDFLNFLPPTPARILDVGAGAGQNAAALADMGYYVTAVEPMTEFLNAARRQYPHASISWVDDSLPMLRGLDKEDTFDFILLTGVWHHLNDAQRATAIKRLSSLLKTGGRCALSLRNGPAGLGTCVYPTDVDTTIQTFKVWHFNVILCLKDQPSIINNKESVTWARLVLEKR
jgi:2-polyprenyl-3-methyl-5-hydroxy-6-metoxy-1,4-benzoquinol methylase